MLESGGVAPRVLNFGARWEWWATRLSCFIPPPPGNSPWYPLDKGLGGSERGQDVFEERIKCFLRWELLLFVPLVVASQATSTRLFLSQHLSGKAGDATDKSCRPATREFASRRRRVSWGHKKKFHAWRRRRVLRPFHSLPWLPFPNSPTGRKSADPKVVSLPSVVTW
jgi:hypothetical protein